MLYIISLLFILMIIYQMWLIKKYKTMNKDEMSYVATLTHDLKSPANAQLNMLNLLLKGQFGELNPKQYEMLKLTRSSVKYMSNLVGTALSDYKYKCNMLAISKTNFDLVLLINDVIKENESLVEEKELNILFKYPPKGCCIYADKLQMQRVIINLISNAINYSFGESTILINLDYSENFVSFSISNKSYYIKPKDLKNIFDKFSKTKNSILNKNSTGMGLHTAKAIVKLHGGNMYAHSTPDGICTFGFNIPIKSTSKESVKSLN